MTTKAAKIKGNKKCKAKNRFKVGLSTDIPPQITGNLQNSILKLFTLILFNKVFRLCLQPTNFIFISDEPLAT